MSARRRRDLAGAQPEGHPPIGSTTEALKFGLERLTLPLAGFGVLVMGVITAIGGGTLRDVIIDAPVFWGADLTFIWVALAASLAAFAAHSSLAKLLHAEVNEIAQCVAIP